MYTHNATTRAAAAAAGLYYYYRYSASPLRHDSLSTISILQYIWPSEFFLSTAMLPIAAAHRPLSRRRRQPCAFSWRSRLCSCRVSVKLHVRPRSSFAKCLPLVCQSCPPPPPSLLPPSRNSRTASFCVLCLVFAALISAQTCPGRPLDAVIVQPTALHTATMIFLHGLGDSGHGWSQAGEVIGRG